MVKIIAPEEAFRLVQSHQLSAVYSGNVSLNFSWREVLASGLNTDAMIFEAPVSVYINALEHSFTLEIIRGIFGVPLIMTSGGWYRHPIRNQEAGGAANSEHLRGLATDFQVMGRTGPQSNAMVQRILDPLPFMQRCGLEFTKGSWTHVDSRGEHARFNA